MRFRSRSLFTLISMGAIGLGSLTAFAQFSRNSQQRQTSEDMRQMLTRATMTLPQMIQKAEQITGGKCVSATVLEFERVRDQVLRQAQMMDTQGRGQNQNQNQGLDTGQNQNQPGQTPSGQGAGTSQTPGSLQSGSATGTQTGSTTGTQSGTSGTQTGTSSGSQTGTGTQTGQTGTQTGQQQPGTQTNQTGTQSGQQGTGQMNQPGQLGAQMQQPKMSMDQLQKIEDSQPVGLIVCTVPNDFAEVVISAESGEVLALKRMPEFAFGRSAFLGSMFARDGGRMNERGFGDRGFDQSGMRRDRDGGRFSENDQGGWSRSGNRDRMVRRDRSGTDTSYEDRQHGDTREYGEDRWIQGGTFQDDGRGSDDQRWGDEQDQRRRGGQDRFQDDSGGDSYRGSERSYRGSRSSAARDRMGADQGARSEFGDAQRWQKISDLRQKPVRAKSDDRELGDIEDLVIDPDAGRVTLAVINFEDNLGHEKDLYAVPFRLIELAPDYEAMTLEYQKDEIERAGGFAQNEWPNMAEETYLTRLYQSFGIRPDWQTGRGGRDAFTARDSSRDESAEGARRPASDVRRDRVIRTGGGQAGASQEPRRWQKASDMLGKDVRNPQNEDLGELHEIVVDPDTGRILYGVLSSGGILGVGDDLFAIPWDSLRLAQDYESIVVNIDAQTLDKADGFDKNNWPDMADPNWSERIERNYGGNRGNE